MRVLLCSQELGAGTAIKNKALFSGMASCIKYTVHEQSYIPIPVHVIVLGSHPTHTNSGTLYYRLNNGSVTTAFSKTGFWFLY